jgi:DNA-binding CsgD family transcriptional regulator/catechol 2,3-dioxygenase-like lactoylglutathione lyase family enzyme
MSSRRGRPRHPDLLTPTEWRIADAVRHGMSTRQIASRRGISPDAVKFHVANVLAKLGLSSRADLRHWAGVPATSGLRAASDQLRQKGTTAMTGETRLGPIGQIARPVSDVTRAVAWYRDVLGLTHLYTFGDLAFFDCGGVRLFLSAEEGEGKAVKTAPKTAPAVPSLLYFRVPDIQSAHAALAARGVEFRGAPHLVHKHEDGVEEWMAFFDDLDGHPLALMSQIGP